MSSERVLFCVIVAGILLVLATWLLGHVWVFIIIVFTALSGIAWSSRQKGKTSDDDRQE